MHKTKYQTKCCQSSTPHPLIDRYSSSLHSSTPPLVDHPDGGAAFGAVETDRQIVREEEFMQYQEEEDVGDEGEEIGEEGGGLGFVHPLLPMYSGKELDWAFIKKIIKLVFP